MSDVFFFSEHAKEMGSSVPSEPVVFLKPTTAYLTDGNPILVSIDLF
jgi:acylpyruvate hydrolase